MNAIRIKRLSKKLDTPISSIYHLISEDPTFPRQFRVGRQRVAWDEDEVDRWLEAKKLEGTGESGSAAGVARDTTQLSQQKSPLPTSHTPIRSYIK